jgi:hypothetical protein
VGTIHMDWHLVVQNDKCDKSTNGDRMKDSYKLTLESLKSRDWEVLSQNSRNRLPKKFLIRYSWISSDIISFLEQVTSVVNSEGKVWFNTAVDIKKDIIVGTFAWNQWEIDSLTAAKGFPKIEKKCLIFGMNIFL